MTDHAETVRDDIYGFERRITTLEQEKQQLKELWQKASMGVIELQDENARLREASLTAIEVLEDGGPERESVAREVLYAGLARVLTTPGQETSE